MLQLVGALAIYGKLGITAPPWLGTAHRIAGTITVLLLIFVGYNCLWALGLESGPEVSTRVVVHGVLGCVLFGALGGQGRRGALARSPGLVPARCRRAAVRAGDRGGLDVSDLVPRRPRLALQLRLLTRDSSDPERGWCADSGSDESSQGWVSCSRRWSRSLRRRSSYQPGASWYRRSCRAASRPRGRSAPRAVRRWSSHQPVQALRSRPRPRRHRPRRRWRPRHRRRPSPRPTSGLDRT